MDFKKLIPDFNALKSVDWKKPALDTQNILALVGLAAAALMVVFVFLPWFGIEFFVKVNRLGITLWSGIFGLIFGLAACAGSLYKQPSLTFCASAGGVLMGLLGMICYASLTYNGHTESASDIKEALDDASKWGMEINVNRIGAILYFIAAVASTAISYLAVTKKQE